VTNRAGTALQGRYLFVGDLQGTAGSGHVGLSEIRLYGRDPAEEQLVFVAGDGQDDSTIRIRGNMTALNAALAEITYTPNPDYNSGNPNAVPSNVTPDEVVIEINDLGNSDVATPPGNTNPADPRALWVRETVSLTVHPIQDSPTLDVSSASRSVQEGGTVTLGPIVVGDIDAARDPAWRGEVTLTAGNGTLTLPANMTVQPVTLGGLGDAIIDGTEAGNPSVSVAPDGGEGGYRDEDNLLNNAGLTLVDVDGDPGTAAQWVHSAGVNDFTKWSVSGSSAGVLIDLGQSRTLDVLQVWNFNAEGLASWGADEFDVYVSTAAARPASLSDLTPVRAGLTLETAPAGVAEYLGETYLFGGAGTNVLPAELGDQTTGPTPVAEELTGRWLYLVLRDTDGSGHVGLSELKFYGRPAAAADVHYVLGDGLADSTLTIRGSLAGLNAALAAVQYTANPGYNSGNPNAGAVVPDQVQVMLTDKVDGVISTHVPVDPATVADQTSDAYATVLVTVGPKNETPTVDISGVTETDLDEDTSLVLGPIVVGDPDQADDPLWQGQVTLTAANGTLTLPAALTTAQLPRAGTAVVTGQNADGSGNVAAEAGRSAEAAFDGSGLTLDPVSGRLIHGSDESGGAIAWSVAQETGGYLIDLGAAYRVDLLQIWNFNVAGLESYGTSRFDLWVGDSLTALTRVLDNEPLARAAAGDANYQGQTFLFSGATNALIPPELGDESGGVTNRAGTALQGRYLFVGDLQGTAGSGHVGLSEIRLYGRDPAEEQLVFVAGDGQDDSTIRIRGNMTALNAALAQITYTPNPDYNSGNPNAVPPNVTPDEVVIEINDLGNSDVATPPGNTNPADPRALWVRETVSLTVHPIQDSPTLDVSGVTSVTAVEDTDLRLQGIVLRDVDAGYDPAWRGTLTVSVEHGTLRPPAGVNMEQVTGITATSTQLDGSRTTAPSEERPAANATDGNGLSQEDIGGGVLKTVHSSDPVQDLGWVLAQESGGLLLDLGAVYAVDVLQIWNFNENLLEDYGPRSFDLWISAGQTAPDSTADMTQLLDDELLERATVGDATYQGQTYLFSGTTVAPDALGDEDSPRDLSGTLVRARYLLLTDLRGATGSGHVGLGEVQVYGRQEQDSLTMTGSFADLNAWINGTVYHGDRDYNNVNFPTQPETVHLHLDDLVSTHAPKYSVEPSEPTAEAAFSIVVEPLSPFDPAQDPPTIPTVPGPQTIVEDEEKLIDQIEVFDVDARSSLSGGAIYDPNWIGEVKLSVEHGTLRLSQGPVNVIPAGYLQVEARQVSGGTVNPQYENDYRQPINAVNGSGLRTVPDGQPEAGKLYHDATESILEPSGWSLAQQDGALLIDLGAVYVIEGLQIWNFNLSGLESYGPESFDLYVSALGSAMPASAAAMTQVLDDQPLARAVTGTPYYLGETYLFDGAEVQTTWNWGDQTDGPTAIASGTPLVARYLLLSDLRGADGVSHVGLSEVQIAGRQVGAGAAELVFTEGDGVGDRTVSFRGRLDDLNAVLAEVYYLPDLHYNSGTAGNVVPDVLTITIDDLGNTDSGGAGIPRQAQATVDLVVSPAQDRPEIDVDGATGAAVDEEGSVTLGPIVISDVDHELDGSILDPDWTGQVTLQVANGTIDLPESARHHWIPLQTGDAFVNGTNAEGTASLVPEGGEGGTRDEDHVVSQAGLSANEAGQLIHSNALNDFTKWSIARQFGGLMIDLGQVYVIDVMQIWNFNAAGSYDYGATSFDLWTSSDAVMPVGTAGMTPVTAAVSLNRASAAADADGYLGETYLWSQATPEVVPSELGDEDGLVQDFSGHRVEGRFLFLGNLAGTDRAGGHVGLSEIRLYGRPVTAPQLVFNSGDGVDDATVTITGRLADLNAALDGIVYRPNPNYNSGNPATENVLPDSIVVTVSDLGHTGGAEMTGEATVGITVNPKQDRPQFPVVPEIPNTDVVEDVAYQLPQIGIFDVDVRQDVVDPQVSWTPAVRELDPAWRGEVTLSVDHGTLWLADGLTTQALPLPGDAVTLSAEGRQADGGVLDAGVEERAAVGAIDQDGLTTVNVDGVDKLIHGTGNADGWSLSQVSGGLLIDLGAEYKIDVLQIWNFLGQGPDGEDLTGYGPQSFDLWTASGTVAPADVSEMTLVQADVPLARAVYDDPDYFGETYRFSGATAEVIPEELADEDGEATDLSFLAVQGRYLFLANLQGEPALDRVGLSAVRVYGRPVTAPDLVFTQGSGRGGERTVSFQGSLDELNGVLNGNVWYQSDEHYNSGDPDNDPDNPEAGNPVPGALVPDVLTVKVRDLGNTDIDPAAGEEMKEIQIDLRVNPKQDAPEIVFQPAVPTIQEDAGPLSLPFIVFDVDARSDLVPGPATLTFDPDWQGQVTLSVQHGTLTLPSTTLAHLAFLDGDGVADRAMTFVGSLDDLNAALAGLQYKVDANFNSNIGSELLQVEISDLVHTENVDPAEGAKTDLVELPIVVLPVNDSPVLTVPLVQPLMGTEDTSLPVPGITVADVDAAEGTGELRLTASVLNGTLTVTAAGAIDIQGNGSTGLILTGTQTDITDTLASLTYLGKEDFSGADALVLSVNDQGNAGGPGVDVPGTVFLTITPVNDEPTLDLPGYMDGVVVDVYEDTNLALPDIVVGDDKDGKYSPVTLRVTFTALHGTINVNTNVTGGVGLSGVQNNGTSSVSLTGTPAVINATLAHATGIVYRGLLNYNNWSTDGDADPNEELVVAVNDLGNVGAGGWMEKRETVTISVVPVNDAPSITSPGPQTLDENDTAFYMPLLVADVDAHENPQPDAAHAVTLVLKLTDADGNLLTTAGTLTVREDVTTGLNSANGTFAGNGTAQVTLTGLPADITETLLDATGLHYLPAENFNGSLQIVATVQDHGNSGGAGLSQTVTIPVTVNAVNNPPEVSVAEDSYSVDEGLGANVVISGVQVSDVDAASTAPGHIMVTLSVPAGQGVLTVTAGVTDGVPADRITANDSSLVTLTGTPAEITATLNAPGGIGYTVPNGDFNDHRAGGPVLLTVTADDLGRTGSGGALTDTQTVTISVHPVNDPPVVTVPASQTMNEGVGATKLITGIRVTDVDLEEAGPANLTVTLSIPVNDGALSVATGLVGGVTDITGNGTETVQLVGSLAQLYQTLTAAGVTYTVPNGDFNIFNNGGPVQLTVTANDQGQTGAAAGDDVTAWMAITVNAINDDPTITAPAPTQASALVRDEDTPVVFSASLNTSILVDDADKADTAGYYMDVRIVANHGTFQLAGTDGLSNLSGDGTGTVTFRGGVEDVNEALAGAVFTPTRDFNGPTTVQITVNDRGNTGGGPSFGGKDVSRVVNLQFTALNDFPEIVVAPAALTTTEDVPGGLPIQAIQISDPDVTETAGGELLVTLRVSHGTLTVRDNLGTQYLKPADITNNGTRTVTLTATPAEIHNTLTYASGSVFGLIYQPDPQYFGPDQIVIDADDQERTGLGGRGFVQGILTLTVNSVNDAPVLTVPSAKTMQEDGTLRLPGISVSDEDAGDAEIRVQLSVTKGTLQVATDVFGGVTSVPGNNSGTVTLLGTMAAINATLGDPNGLQYTPYENANGVEHLVVLADDLGHAGGDDTPATDTKTVTITIAAVNDPPQITVPESSPSEPWVATEDVSRLVTGVTVTDVDAAEGTGQIRFIATATNGTLTVGTNVPNGVPAGGILNNGGSSIILTGTPDQINTTLAGAEGYPGLTYLGRLDYFGTDQLVVSVDDLGNFGSGPTVPTPPPSSTVTIQVVPVNDPPLAAGDSFSMAERHPTDAGRPPLTVAASLLTSNDAPGPANEQGDQTIQIVADGFGTPSQGSVAYDGTNVIYTPPAYFNGTATFTYTIIDDGSPAKTAVGTVTVTVTAVNDPPVPGTDTGATNEDTAKTFTETQLLENDAKGPTAPAGTVDNETSQVLTLSSVTPLSAAGGTVTLSSGTVTYTPPANFNGTDTFTYRVTDNGRTSGQIDRRDAIGTVTVTVAAVNDGPQVVTPANVQVSEDLAGPIAGISVSDLDVGSGTLAVTLRVGHGSLTVNVDPAIGGLLEEHVDGNGTGLVTIAGTLAQINATFSAAGGLQYLSHQDYNGSDSLIVTVSDGGQTGIPNPASPSTVTRTITLTVQAMNDAPTVSVPGGQTVLEDESFYFGAIQVSDVDAGETQGANVRVTLTVDNGVLLVNTGLTGGLTGGDVQNNNTRSVVLTGTLAAMNNTLGNASGVLYRPTADFFGNDTVNVTVSDLGNTGLPGAQTAATTVTIAVTPVNDVPSAVNDPGLGDPPFTVDENTVLKVAGRGVLANDTDVDGDDLYVVIEGAALVAGKYTIASNHGAPVVIDAEEGTFSFDPTNVAVFQALRAGQTLTDAFVYQASDGTAVSNPATVTITVTGVNDAPVAGQDTYTVADNTVLDSASPSVAGLLANDYDPESETLTVLVGSSDSLSRLGAAVTIQANGEFTYDPRSSVILAALKAGDPPMNDTFQYTVADASGLATQATVTVTVTGGNSNPVPAADQYSTVENEVLTVAPRGVLVNDTDPDSDDSGLTTVVQTVVSQYGAQVQIGPNGGFTYDSSNSTTLRALETGQSMQDSFQYQVRDDLGAGALGTVLVIVNGVSDPPYQNAANTRDVNADGMISPMDVLILINYLNTNGPVTLPAGMPRPPYLDVNGDGAASAADVILVVNTLNNPAAGEGEAALESTPVLGADALTATEAGACSFSALSGDPAATASQDGLPIASGAAAVRLTVADPAVMPVAQAVPAEPAEALFDAWDADDSEWEDTLAAIAGGGSGAAREAATDALLEAMFG